VLAVSLFLVNRRSPAAEPEFEDEAMASQAEIEVDVGTSIVARVDLSGRDGEDIDARIADLHYRDVVDWAVGHNVSVEAELDENGSCHRVRTCWLPLAFVPRLIPGEIAGVELGMDPLASLADAAGARAALENLPKLYRDWIDQQQGQLPGLSNRQRDVATALLAEARRAVERIEDGIALLADPRVLDGFRLMNQAVAAAARRRRPGEPPKWYPFQLAFILLNLRGLVTPEHDERETVDLLFFPTGGGKNRGLSRACRLCDGLAAADSSGPWRVRARCLDALHFAAVDARSARARRRSRLRARTGPPCRPRQTRRLAV
jgi:hypothetical protein